MEAPTRPDRDVIDVVLGAIDAKDLKDIGRFKVLSDELQEIKGTLRDHDKRIAKVERNAFPTFPLWALVGIGLGELALHIGLAVLR